MSLKAPGYGQQDGVGPRINIAPLPSRQASPSAPLEAFGGGAGPEQEIRSAQQLGAAGEQLGSSVQAMANKLREDADNTVVGSRDVMVEHFKNEAMDKTLQLKGQDATAKSPVIAKEFEDNAKKAAEGLTPSQQYKFNQRLRQHSAELDRVQTAHSSQESQKWANEVSTDKIKGYSVDAERNPFDPGFVAGKKRDALTELNTVAARQGIQFDDEGKPVGEDAAAVFAKDRLKVTTDFHMGVINARAAAGAPASAKTYYDVHKDEIDPERAQQIKDSIKEAGNRASSQQMVDDLMKKFNSFGAAKPSIDAIKDPDLRDATEERAIRQYALQAKVDADNNNRLMLGYVGAVKDAKSTDIIPPAEFKQLNSDQQSALKAIAAQNSGVPVKPDPAVYSKYSGMLPGEIANVSASDLATKVEPYVSPDQFKEISNYWAKSKDTDQGGYAASKSMFNDKQLVFNALQKSKLIPPTMSLGTVHKDEKANETYLNFAQKVDDGIASYTHDNGRPPDSTAKQKIIDDLLIKKVFVSSGHWFTGDKAKPVSILTSDEAGNSYVKLKDIPPQHVSNMRTRATMLGNASIDNDQMQRAYAAALENDSTRVDQILSGK